MKFVWNRAKAASNERKHGVSLDEATTIFGDPLSGTIPDPDHSLGEHRFITIGLSSSGRLLVVCHTEEDDVFRIMNAREATTYERKRYQS